MAAQDPVKLRLEWTPNPSTIKYMVNREFLPKGAANFPGRDAASAAPLPRRLFDVPGVTGVMIGQDFVTITKSDEADWEDVHNHVSEAITTHLTAGESVFGDFSVDVSSAPVPGNAGAAEQVIRRILDEEIRPAVAMDGGDITFHKYEDGILFLHMKGSCHGCPSSTATLRMGIEARIREAVPELVEVVAI